MDKKLRILMVTNSVPLPASDFLKHKLFHLSKQFDVHLICWGSNAVRESFYKTYSQEYNGGNIHLFFNKLDAVTIFKLVLLHVARLLFNPFISIPLLGKLLKKYGRDKKTVFLKFTHYYPIACIKPRIVHFEYGTLAHRFSDIKEFVHCKATASFRGYDINYVGLEQQGYYSRVWTDFDGFHFLGNDLRKRAVARGYMDDKTEALIPPGIDTSLFTPKEKKQPEDKLVLLSVGRLVWKKGYEYALHAVAILKQRGIQVTYRIIGEGSHKQAIQFAILQMGLQDDVVLLGECTPAQVKEQLYMADIFLHPALSEGFSNAVLEAQAVGLPVVATDADGLPENVADGITGFIVPVYNAAAIAEKLEWCHNNRIALQQMGMAGIERVNTHFTVEQQMQQFSEFYNKVSETGAG